jgi:hypothetical protein
VLGRWIPWLAGRLSCNNHLKRLDRHRERQVQRVKRYLRNVPLPQPRPRGKRVSAHKYYGGPFIRPLSGNPSCSAWQAICPILFPNCNTVSVTTEGQHKLYFFSQDVAGNQETQESVTFGIDLTPPNTMIATATPRWACRSRSTRQKASAE